MLSTEADFFEACRRGDVDKVKQFYEQDNSLLNIEDVKCFPPLIIAVYNNQPDVVDFLLEKGARVEMNDQSGNTALMGVCFRGYKELVSKLLNAGVDVNKETRTEQRRLSLQPLLVI
ncbi:MAG: ankyrin repeat protein [Segetibacter sp.]|nr:ankyrin repeat protein [Segetibacter sp.]